MRITDQPTNPQLGPYLLAEQLGRGGAATVYRAHQSSLARDVAVKVLLANVDPQFAARFEREARAIASLNHPNILPVYDFGTQGDVRYLVMRYVEGGRTLRTTLGHGLLEPVPALRLIAYLLDGLAYAHARGIVHRDIKPANVLLPSPDWPLLADFGIAQVGTDTRQLTGIGQVIGTPDYMSPEQGSGHPVDQRSDLYSVGVILYEMLTGQLPFRANSPMAVVVKHVSEPPPSPRTINPNLPVQLEPILLRALEKSPDARYQSAAEMASALRQVADQLERAVPYVAPRPQPAARPRYTWLPALGLIGILGVIAVGWNIFQSDSRQLPPVGVSPSPTVSTGASRNTLRLEDERWQGGFRRANGPTIYGGRTATWIYGFATDFSSMTATFNVRGNPRGTALLRIEGMDSEGRAKTQISIKVNDVEIYRGPNPLPDDDLALETGTWETVTWEFDASLLQSGSNQIQISNMEEGAFSLPPFFMLDYAEITVE